MDEKTHVECTCCGSSINVDKNLFESIKELAAKNQGFDFELVTESPNHLLEIHISKRD